MEKKLRRLLVLLATVALLVCVLTTGVFATEADEPACYRHGDLNGDGKITHRDAIHLLYASFGYEGYSLNQDGDFNGDGSVTQKDAFYLLYASFDDEDCPLDGWIHHYDATWSWIDGDLSVGATATLKCGCPDEEPIVYGSADAEHMITIEEKVDQATCTKNGEKTYTGTFTMNGETYTSTKTYTIEKTGHDLQGEWDCVNGVECANCDYAVEAKGHEYEVTSSVEATCTVASSVTKTCSVCGDVKTVVGSVLPHKYEYTETVTDCTHAFSYVCACGATSKSGSYVQHSYNASLTKEATCTEAGVKTYICECGHSYTKEIEANATHHVWGEGVTAANGVITYECACGETKTAVAVSNDTAVTASAESELKLENDAFVALDTKTVEGLGEETQIKVSVEEVSVEDKLTSEQLKQIGDNPVYDFNMISVDAEGNKIDDITDFDGEVTVSLPYKLVEGEDIDSIDVWYIDSEGNLDRMDATYSNGYVTFTTTHFSYYTVTRLTAAERCDRYGHNRIDERLDATCTEGGYIQNTCQRCGDPGASEDISALGHDYTATTTAATCTADGKIEKVCSVCKDTATEVIPALGHSITSTVTPATCTTTGKSVDKCTNCDYNVEKLIPMADHDYGEPVVVEATCTEGGYTKAVCAACGYESIGGETAPLGHAYAVAENGWTWAEDNSEATVTLVCAHDAAHTKVLKAVVTVKTVNATCQAAGATIYTATAANGTATYTDTKTITTEAVDHQPAAEWSSNAAEHYHVCSVCNEKLGAAAHTWGAETVIKAPTCTTVGTAKVACTACGYETEKTLLATGEHTYVNGVCSVCGHDANVCEHLRVYKTEIDLSGYNICEGSQIWNVACDCGEKSYPNFQLKCNLVEDENGVEATLPDGTEVTIWTAECTDCDLKVEYSYYNKIDVVECAYRWCEYYKVSAGDELITEGTWIGNPMEEHPYTDDAVKTYDMAELGLCAGTIEVFKCPCGFATGWSFNGGCDWVTVEGSEEDLNGDGILTYTFECSVCGAIRVRNEYNRIEEDICAEVYYEDNTYYVDGVAVLELNTKHGFSRHDYVCESYEMDGESCEDGLLYTLKCQNCGDVNKNYVTGHAEIVRTVIDLPEDVCTDALIQYTCPCEAKYGYWEMVAHEDTACEWEYKEENGVETYTCLTCGLSQTITEESTEKDENCIYVTTNTRVFVDKDGNELATVYGTYWNEDHDMVTTTKLLVENGKCTDGVEITNACADCGYFWSGTEYGHIGRIVETFDLSEMGMCCTEANHYVCACGESDWISFGSNGNYCEWSYYGMSDGTEMWVCNICDATRTITREELERIDACHVKSKYTHTITTNAPEAYVIEVEQVDAIHAGEWFELELFDGATDCTGGVDIYMNCDVCGVREHWGTTHDHSCWPVNTEVLCEEGLCSTLKLVEVSCACGYDSWSYYEWEGEECEFQYHEWNEELQMNTSKCVKCGAIRTRQSVETPIEGETCRFNAVTTYAFYDADGKELCAYTVEENGERHDNLCTFRMVGDTCEEGYYVIRTCQRCGNVEDYNDYYSSCETFRTAKEVLYTSDCGEVALYQWRSPCGEQMRWNVEGDCEFMWQGWDEKLGMEIAECTKCGQQVAQRSEQERIPGTCSADRTSTFVVLVDGAEVARQVKTFTTQSHQYVHNLQLQGETCDDGFTVSAKCAYCDAGYSDENIRYGHENFLVAYYDLTDYGLCSGALHIYDCACGQSTGWGHNNWNCEYEHIGVDDAETGLPIKQCSETGIYFVDGEIGEEDSENCRYNGIYYLKVFGADYNAEPELNVSYEFSHESHTQKATTLTLLNPEGTCDDGVYAQFECLYCGETGEETYYHHRHWTTDTLNLDEYPGTCGGELRVGGCACGQETFFHRGYECQSMNHVDDWYDEDENGIGHQFNEFACASCGLSYVEEHYTVDNDAACSTDSYWTYTFYVNDTQIGVFEQNNSWENHDYVASGVLLNGATSCDGGVLITAACQRCDHVTNWTTSGHETFKTESIDLTLYGAECGDSKLEHYTCACGAYERYNLNTENACDVDWQNLTESEWWVNDVINDYQETTEGGQGIWSNFYNVKCAVSDPACGLSMKMAEYWLKDGCQVTEYQHWQILDADGNVAWDSGHITTGETRGFHDYTETFNQESADDGSYVNNYSYICNDCGSTYEYQDSYNSTGDHVKFEGTAINKLDNGENQKWYRYWIREDVYNGHYDFVVDYDEWIRANGETDWTCYEYTYGYPNSCTQTCHYTNSNGEDRTWTNEAHVGNWYNDSKSATCTQFGYYEEYGYCDICGTRWSEYYEEYAPYCHNWYYDEGAEIYRCSYCQLESTQGASGAIVMEDLSGYYHQGFSYIVGYWNREDIEFTVNVSVVMEDSTAEDNLIDLNEDALVVPVWDLNETGVDAKWIDKDTAHSAAEAAMAEAGYTGSYAIRMAFVFEGSGTGNDYAITFDTITPSAGEVEEGEIGVG